MDVERTMEFILAQQARNEEQHARNEVALAELIAAQKRSDRRVDRLERTVTRLARLGVKARTKVNGRLDDHEKWLQDMQTLMTEIGGKLNALIGYVDDLPRNSPQS
jgi:predicted transcriptional regulator